MIAAVILIAAMFVWTAGNEYNAASSTDATIQTILPSYTRVKPKTDYSIDVNVNIIDVIVRGENGEHIKGLTRDDFELYEDGQKQRILAVNLIDHSKKIIKSEKKEVKPVAKGTRYFAFLIANLPKYDRQKNQVVESVARFITNNMGMNDKVALYNLSRSTVEELLPYTDNKKRILSTLDRYVKSGKFRRNSYVESQRDKIAEHKVKSMGKADHIGISHDSLLKYTNSMSQNFSYRNMMQYIEIIASNMNHYQGRKNIVLVTEGLPEGNINFTDNAGHCSLRDPISKEQFMIREKLESTLNTYNIAFYPLIVGPYIEGSAKNGGKGYETLAGLSSATGGMVMAAENVSNQDIMKNLDNMNYDTASYYEISYAPDGNRTPGDVFEIDVKVNKQHSTLKYRKNISIPEKFESLSDERKTVQILLAARGGGEFLDLTLETDVRFFPGAENKTRTLLSAQTLFDDVFHIDDDDRECDVVGYMRITDDKNGKADEYSRLIKFALKKGTQLAVEDRLRYFELVDLAPGEYYVKFFLGDRTNGKMASDEFRIRVPQLSAEKHTISNILLVGKNKNKTLAVSKYTPLPGMEKVKIEKSNPLNIDGHVIIHDYPAIGKPKDLDTMLVELKGYSVDYLKSNAGNLIKWAVFEFENNRLGNLKKVVNARLKQIAPHEGSDVVGLVYKLNLGGLTPGKYVIMAVMKNGNGDAISSPLPIEIAGRKQTAFLY